MNEDRSTQRPPGESQRGSVYGSTGTAQVTFLVTDVVDLTRLVDEDIEAAAEAVLGHDEILWAWINYYEGDVITVDGDSFAAAFRTTEIKRSPSP